MEGRYNFQSFGVHPIFLHAQGKHLEHMIWWMHSVCLHVELNYEYIQLIWNLHSIGHTCMIPLDGILFSFKHEVYVSMVIFMCHMCLCWSRLICRKNQSREKWPWDWNLVVTRMISEGMLRHTRWWPCWVLPRNCIVLTTVGKLKPSELTVDRVLFR